MSLPLRRVWADAGWQSDTSAAPAHRPLLQRLQETDEVPDLPGVQSELGHARMPRHNSLGKRLFKRFDRVPCVKGSERRSDGKGALRDLIDRMAMRTIGLRKCLAGHRVGIRA